MTSRRERRRHIVFYTRNSEYHCRDMECVGVRDRRTRRWQRWHPALRCLLVGGVQGDEKMHRLLEPGAKLVFHGPTTVLTSGLLAAGRPPRDSLDYYTSHAWRGVIAMQ